MARLRLIHVARVVSNAGRKYRDGHGEEGEVECEVQMEMHSEREVSRRILLYCSTEEKEDEYGRNAALGDVDERGL